MDRPRLTLLGEFSLRSAEQTDRTLPANKAHALLAVLVLSRGHALPNDKITALLWSDRAETQARDSLKHALADLQRNLPELGVGWLHTGQGRVELDPEAFAADVTDFEALAASDDIQKASAALDMFKGDLLAGLHLRDPAFEDWLRDQRARLHSLAGHCAEKVLRASEVQGEVAAVLNAATRLRQLDPLSEIACRAAMRANVLRGERSTALRMFSDLRDLLSQELNVTPDPETCALEASIRHGPQSVQDASLTLTTPPSAPTDLQAKRPGKPSIAVLAFENLGGDPDQEYFADGIVDDIITALSRFGWLLVIARSSSFTYKGRSVDVRQIGREQGVRYVLEGSLRQAAGQVRINARLIDADSRAQIWSDSFVGDLADIFEIQDQVTTRVVGSIAPRLEQAEIQRATQKPTQNLDAYDYYLKGLAAVHRWTHEANILAIEMFDEAVRRDPEFATAYGWAVRTYSQRRACGWSDPMHSDADKVRALAARAVASGPDDAVALCTAGIGLAFVCGELDDGAALIERALDLNANLAIAWGFSGWVHTWLGEPQRAIDDLAKARLLNPHDPQAAMYHGATACAHFFAHRDADAIVWARRALGLRPTYQIATCVLAAALAVSGKIEEARAIADQANTASTPARIASVLASYPIRRAEDAQRLTYGLTMAGFSF